MPDPETLLAQLRERAGVIQDIAQAGAVLSWDQNTYMPEGAAEARGQQLATLEGLVHERLSDPAFGDLVADLERAGLEPESVDAAMVREAGEAVRRATKLPASLVEALSKQATRARAVWGRARARNDVAAFAPELERMVELKREQAEALGYRDHPYDALHDLFEPGSTAAAVRRVFEPLATATSALVNDIVACGWQPDDAPLRQDFDEAGQERFARDTVAAFGYDFSRGRLDRTVHPFATSFSKYDVRITTRFQPRFLNTALFGTLHEAGHGMYEQGIDDAFYRTPLESTASLGIHESQSRLWENLVGRSLPFWQGAYGRLQGLFPAQLGGVPLREFHAAINRVSPSLIRVEADEVTYNLHIMLRFELELALLEGSLTPAGLPEAWNDRMQTYLGITPPDDAHGCLQDVHWSVGLFGYFPTYALGNLMSVQLLEAARRALPALDDDLRAGSFTGLLGWLRENVHRHGSRYRPQELLQRATGQDLDAAPYLAYLHRKYGALYGLA